MIYVLVILLSVTGDGGLTFQDQEIVLESFQSPDGVEALKACQRELAETDKFQVRGFCIEGKYYGRE